MTYFKNHYQQKSCLLESRLEMSVLYGNIRQGKVQFIVSGIIFLKSIVYSGRHMHYFDAKFHYSIVVCPKKPHLLVCIEDIFTIFIIPVKDIFKTDNLTCCKISDILINITKIKDLGCAGIVFVISRKKY